MSEIVQPLRFCGVLCIARSVSQLTRCFSAVAELLVAVGDKKKGKERKGKVLRVTSRHISAIWGADLFGPISTQIGKLVGVHGVIIHSNFGFNIYRGRNFRFPIDFAGHRYYSADTTAQPVIGRT